MEAPIGKIISTCVNQVVKFFLGVTKTVRKRIEVPREWLERTLLEGEEVIGQYDYFYSKKGMYLTDVSIFRI